MARDPFVTRRTKFGPCAEVDLHPARVGDWERGPVSPEVHAAGSVESPARAPNYGEEGTAPNAARCNARVTKQRDQWDGDDGHYRPSHVTPGAHGSRRHRSLSRRVAATAYRAA